MKFKILFFFIVLFCFSGFAQKQKWFEKEHREKKWPKQEYYKAYEIFSLDELGEKQESNLIKINKAEELIKESLSSKILVEVNVEMQASTQKINGQFNHIFRKVSSSETSISFSGLQIKKQEKGKNLHILILIKKDDLKEFAKNRFKTWVTSLQSELNACRSLKDSKVYQEALERANQISNDKKVLDRISNLLLALSVPVDRTQFEGIKEELSFLTGFLEDKVQGNNQYHQQKLQAENIIGNTLSELEEKRELLETCKKIAPDLAQQDGISELLELTKSDLFNLYCIEASNSEDVKKWEKAILFYEKAKNIDPTKKVQNTTETPFSRLIQCKEKYQKDLSELGKQEYKAKNFLTAKNYFEDAKEIIKTLKDNSKELQKINKEIIRCNNKLSEPNKNKNSSAEKTPARILIRLNGGLNSYLQDWESFKFNQLSFHSKARHLSGFLGYRFNLRDEVRISKRGKYDRSKANAVGLFVKSGDDYFWDDSYRTFMEFELGILWQEIFRLSIGPGFVQEDFENITLQDVPYYVATAGLSINFGQFFIAPSISYLSKEQATITGDDKIRTNLSLGFRILLF